MSIPASIKGVSDKLNIQSQLCDRTWRVYNEEDVKVVYIFQKDGSLIVSQNGVVSKSKWEYIKANKSIIIEEYAQTLLLHPTFFNDVLFILQQDGVDKYITMIDESKQENLALISLDSILEYLNKISQQSQSICVSQQDSNDNSYKSHQIIEEHRSEVENETSSLKDTFVILICVTLIFLGIGIITLVRETTYPAISIILICLGLTTAVVSIIINSEISQITNEIVRKNSDNARK